MKIETAIQKLSLAEQRTIALHLGERLVEVEPPGTCAAADEGIRFLPRYDSCPVARAFRNQKFGRRARVVR